MEATGSAAAPPAPPPPGRSARRAGRQGWGAHARRLRHALLPVVPALGLLALELGHAFEAGGYFAGTSALGAALVSLALIAHVMRARRPFEGLSAGVVVAAGALGLLAVWTLVSAIWSDSPARALVEFDRALL